MKINSLHYIRGLAALFVLFTHLVNRLTWDLETNIFVQMFASFGTESVVVFFLLSGIVISHTTLNNGIISIKKYFYKRIKRIIPLSWIAISFALVVYFILYQSLPNAKVIILNFLFFGTIEGVIVPVINTIDPLWSLSYEIFFYIFFAFFILKFGRIGFVIWLAISFFAIFSTLLNIFDTNYVVFINRIFAFSIIWLLGYIVYSFKLISFSMIGSLQVASLFFMTSRVVLSDDYYEPLKWAIAALVLVPLFYRLYRRGNSEVMKVSKFEIIYFIILYGIVFFYFNAFNNNNGFKNYMYVLFPLLPLILHIEMVKSFFVYCYNNSKPVLNFLGNISFPLYMIHYPLLMLIDHYWDNTSILKPILGISFSILTAIFINKAINKFVT